MVLLNVDPPSTQQHKSERLAKPDPHLATANTLLEQIIAETNEAEAIAVAEIFAALSTEIDSHEPPLETDLHREQIDFLVRLLKYYWRDRPDFYISGNLTVYFNPQQLANKDFRSPDVFVVMNTEKRDRRSWMVWNEGGKYPDLAIELLSNSTAKVDRNTKKQLYQDVWRTPNYVWFHPETLEFAGFHLVDGKYKDLTPTETGLLWITQIELFLGVHDGQLRWFTAEGELILAPEEYERQIAEQERLAKEQALQRAAQLEEILRSHGIDL
ncbi:Uma2 family endonuclease [Pseudanabaena biceps]|nr:Uma2 family endonuclease [Pseudanabaena biceps]